MSLTSVLLVSGGLVYGYNVSSDGYLGGLQDDFHVGTFATELVSGGAALGAMLTMPVSGVLADKIGRRTTVLLGCIPAIVGSGLVSMSASSGQAIAWRVLQGSGNAIAIHAVPIYLSEVAPPAHRAIIVALFQFFVSAGLTAQPLVQLWFGEWRVTAACGMVAPAVLAVLGVFGMGRSPVWLQSRGARSYQSLAVDSGEGATTPPSTRRGSGVGTGAGTGTVAGDSASDGGADVEQASPLLTAQATKRGGKHDKSQHATNTQRAPTHRHGSFNVAATAAAANGDAAEGVGGARRSRCGTGAASCVAAWLAPLYTQPQWATLLTLGVVLAWTNNSTDIFMFYGVQVLEDAGFSGRSPLVLYALLSGCTAVMVAPAMCLIAALPRRPLFLASFAAVVVTYVPAVVCLGVAVRAVRAVGAYWPTVGRGHLLTFCGPPLHAGSSHRRWRSPISWAPTLRSR